MYRVPSGPQPSASAIIQVFYRPFLGHFNMASAPALNPSSASRSVVAGQLFTILSLAFGYALFLTYWLCWLAASVPCTYDLKSWESWNCAFWTYGTEILLVPLAAAVAGRLYVLGWRRKGRGLRWYDQGMVTVHCLFYAVYSVVVFWEIFGTLLDTLAAVGAVAAEDMGDVEKASWSMLAVLAMALVAIVQIGISLCIGVGWRLVVDPRGMVVRDRDCELGLVLRQRAEGTQVLDVNLEECRDSKPNLQDSDSV